MPLFLSALFFAAVSAGAVTPHTVNLPEAPTLESCAKQPPCWKLVREAFGWNFGAMRTEAEASGPGRFFPGLVVFTMSTKLTGGHFLELHKVTRGGPGAEVLPERGELEQRLIQASLLLAVPHEESAAELYDPQSWRLTAAGLKLVSRLEKAKPNLWAGVAIWVKGGSDPETEGPARIKINGKRPR